MILNQLLDNYVFAVIRGKNVTDAVAITDYSIRGGIKNIEITFSTPNAEQAIFEARKQYNEDDSVVIGAGTVMSIEQARIAIEAGAQFLVSPHLSLEISEFAVSKGILYFPGCGSVTEIVAAMNSGAKIIKVFPGGTLGKGFIKAVHGPIPDVLLMPSGGVTIDNVKEWKSSGSCAVGLGSDLTKEVVDGDYSSVEKYAKSFMNVLSGK